MAPMTTSPPVAAGSDAHREPFVASSFSAFGRGGGQAARRLLLDLERRDAKRTPAASRGALVLEDEEAALLELVLKREHGAAREVRGIRTWGSRAGRR